MVMNAKKFRAILGGVVKESVENDCPAIKEVIGIVTSRVAHLKSSDQETVDPAAEIAALIRGVVINVAPVQKSEVGGCLENG